jgi:hypothetical protein
MMPPTKPAVHSPKPGLTRQPTAEERRRAQRVLLKMPVNVEVAGKPTPVQGTTHTVSANGAMIIVKEPILEGTKIVIENPKSQKKIEAKVVRPPQFNPEGSLVPVEFLVAAPNFWGVFFPPAMAN